MLIAISSVAMCVLFVGGLQSEAENKKPIDFARVKRRRLVGIQLCAVAKMEFALSGSKKRKPLCVFQRNRQRRQGMRTIMVVRLGRPRFLLFVVGFAVGRASIGCS